MAETTRSEQFFGEEKGKVNETLYRSINDQALGLKFLKRESSEYQSARDKLFNLFEPIFQEMVNNYVKMRPSVGKYLAMDTVDFLQDIRLFFLEKVDRWIEQWDPGRSMFSLYIRKDLSFRLGDAGKPPIGNRRNIRRQLHKARTTVKELSDGAIPSYVSIDQKFPDDKEGMVNRILLNDADVLGEQERRDAAVKLFEEYTQSLSAVSSQSRHIVQNVIEKGMTLKQAGAQTVKPVSEARASQVLSKFYEVFLRKSRVLRELGINQADVTTRSMTALLQRAYDIMREYQERVK